MAKRKNKKTAYVKIADLRVPKSFMRSVAQFAQTPVGKLIIAEALVVLAGALGRKRPVEAATAAGGAAANMAGSAAETVASLMTSAADHLKAGTDVGSRKGKTGTREASEEENAASKPGNGARGTWDELDSDTVRDAVIGEFSGKKRKKSKAKPAKA